MQKERVEGRVGSGMGNETHLFRSRFRWQPSIHNTTFMICRAFDQFLNCVDLTSSERNHTITRSDVCQLVVKGLLRWHKRCEAFVPLDLRQTSG